MGKEDDFPLKSEFILTQSQLAAVGCVAIESTYLEQEAAIIIWSLLGTDAERGHQVTVALSSTARFELISTLLKQRDLPPQIADAAAKLFARIRAANGQRNTIIHGDWTTSVKNFFLLMRDGADKHPPAKATNNTRRDSTSITADQIMTVARELSECRTELVDLIDRALSEGPPEGH